MSCWLSRIRLMYVLDISRFCIMSVSCCESLCPPPNDAPTCPYLAGMLPAFTIADLPPIYAV